MMNIKNFAVSPVKTSIIFILIDLKRKMGEDVVFVMKAKRHISNVLWKQNHFSFSNLMKVIFN